MPSTRDIRRRIKSVKNTAQITKAMQMVAASKMRRAQQAAILWTVQNSLMDDVAVDQIKDFQARLTDYLVSRKPALMEKIRLEKALSDALIADLKAAVTEFKQTCR